MVTVTHTEGLPWLVRSALSLGAGQVAGGSQPERELAAAVADGEGGQAAPGALSPPAGELAGLISAGEDPLGEALCVIRGATERRELGQTLTPAPVVASMIEWAAAGAGPGGPARVIDPGTGSARFLVAAGRRWPRASLVGIETDPVAALVARANLAAAGLAARSRVILADYRTAEIPPQPGQTLYLGNPPYVRHHQIGAPWKAWLDRTARARGLTASALAGLHVHFFLATACHAAPGDLGAFITAAEWLDVNYGSLVRSLLLGDLGGESVHLLEPDAPVFADATVTSAIACFRPGGRPATLRLRLAGSVTSLGSLAGGHPVPRTTLRRGKGAATRRAGRAGRDLPGAPRPGHRGQRGLGPPPR
jgi:hypothetical protein